MTRVLLTGGSGFIAAHILEQLLQGGHSVVTTVRSQEKANKIKEAYPKYDKSKLDFAIVEDIAQHGAFDKAVISDPPFEAVIHAASPFHFNVTDTKKDLLDPAINGTTGLLKAIKASAPSVKRVVVTSSFAAIINASKGNWPEHTYTEEDWNPVTLEEAESAPSEGYRASKTFAEKAAWDFVKNEKPNFTLSTINPPLVLGPIIHYLNSLSSLNTSNQRVRNFIQGEYKTEIPGTGTFTFVDVRDLATAHIKAMELPEAAGQRFFVLRGYFSNKEICEIIREKFPQYQDKLPEKDVKGGGYPDGGIFKFDNEKSIKVLGMTYRPLEESVVDLVKSLQEAGI